MLLSAIQWILKIIQLRDIRGRKTGYCFCDPKKIIDLDYQHLISKQKKIISFKYEKNSHCRHTGEDLDHSQPAGVKLRQKYLALCMDLVMQNHEAIAACNL